MNVRKFKLAFSNSSKLFSKTLNHLQRLLTKVTLLLKLVNIVSMYQTIIRGNCTIINSSTAPCFNCFKFPINGHKLLEIVQPSVQEYTSLTLGSLVLRLDHFHTELAHVIGSSIDYNVSKMVIAR